MAAFTLLAPLNARLQYPVERLHVGTETVITFQVRELDQLTAFSLTSLTPKFRARKFHSDASYLFTKTGTVTDAALGLCTVTIAVTDIAVASELWGEFWVETTSGATRKGTVTYRMIVERAA